MKPASQTTACVVDHGIFLPVALKLAEQLDRVLYCCPHDRAMPLIQEGVVGTGFDNLDWRSDLWSIKDEVDVFVFPDIGFAGEQRELISQGFPVWGHRGSDKLETNRGLFLRTLEALKMPVPPHVRIEGITQLREHLKDAKDKYIKISHWRGDWETLHWRSWDEDEAALDFHAYKFGPAKEFIAFYVFDPIDTDIEFGIDSYCIDGKFPQTVIQGPEWKDKSFLCSVEKLADVDKRLRSANEDFAPALFDYRGFFSSEVRDKYFIDPTCRAGSPPSQVMIELFENLGEIIVAGAHGELVEPKPAARYGVQALLSTPREKDEWVVLEIDESARRWCKFSYACNFNGRVCIPPNPLHDMLGWLVAYGDSIEEAIDALKLHSEGLPPGIECHIPSIANLLNEAKEAKAEGMELGDGKIPPPQVAIQD